ncbi:MAG: transposase [Bryobacterales bacterium]|nr:transposase [Bryobacterales bacterium]MEB2364339.1 transposase [Bryobacterales bacterium]
MTALRDGRNRASGETIIKSLVGDYRCEHLFTLRQSLAAFRNYQELIAECDREIEEQLKSFDARVDCKAKPLPAPKLRRHKTFGNEPRFDSRAHLYRIFGVDLTQVPGMSILTAHTLLAEVGPDLSRFLSPSAFASWLGLCPDNDITGGKKVAVGTRRVNNRATWALRMAANALRNSRSGLGDYYRRMRAKLGAPKAITAAAHKLARIIFHLLTTRQAYDETVFARRDEHARKRSETILRNQARALRFQLVPAAQTQD